MLPIRTSIDITVPVSLRAAFCEAVKVSAAQAVTMAAELHRDIARDAESAPCDPSDPMAGLMAPPRDKVADEADLEGLYLDWCEDLDLADRLLGLSRTFLGVPDEERRRHWRVDVDAEIARIDVEWRRRHENEKALAQRAVTAEEMTWQDCAKELFGPEYQTALADACHISRKTIQRADRPDGTLPLGIREWLYDTMRIVPQHLRRAYGAAFRVGRMSERGAEGVEMAARDLTRDLRLP